MRRIIVMVLRNLLFVPWYAIQLLLYSRESDRHTEEERFARLKKITIHANKGGSVQIQSDGQEKLPEKNGFIFYPNHQGMYDVLSMIESCDRPFSVVMKQEVKNVPFLIQIRKIMKAQCMDRSDIKQSLKVILEVAKEVSEGRNYVIFPEGTRSHNGNKLLEFKGGSFKAATKAKCPIVPVALLNSYVPFDSHTIKPVTVQVHYLQPLYYEEYKDLKTTEIAAIVKQRIEEKIAECEKASA